MSRVLRSFFDKEDGKKAYSVGDSYNLNDEKRVAYLIEKGFLSGKSERKSDSGVSEFPKHTGGGWYELSNGEKVQGKDEAATAEKELNEKVGE